VIEVSAAQPQDALAIARVHVSSWQAAYVGMMPEDYLASLSVEERASTWRGILGHGATLGQGATEVWIAREAGDPARAPGEVLGFVSIGAYRASEPLAEEHLGEISSLYVSPGHWGRGIGATLWLRASERLAAAGFGTVALWVLVDNVRAIRFYRAMGFREDPGSECDFVLGGHPLRHVRYSLMLGT
jgi:ribosomal protein S18 acetylase RimI-like enzyme